MKTVLVAKTRKLLGIFSDKQASQCTPEYFEENLKTLDQDSLYFLDVKSFGKKRIKELIEELAGIKSMAWALIDQENSISDPGGTFHDGAVDYINPQVISAGVNEKRIAKAIRLFRRGSAPEAAALHEPNSFPGWENLLQGEEYPFIFLYADLPDAENIKRTLGEKRFTKLKDDFIKALGYEVMQAEGRAWMSDGQSMLALFPEDKISSAVLICLQLLISNTIFTYEKFGLSTPAAFRFALHRGRSIWQKPGQTGNVISRDVNFIYHMGRRFAQESTISISGAALEGISPTLRSFFIVQPDFEGNEMFRSRRFLVKTR